VLAEAAKQAKEFSAAVPRSGIHRGAHDEIFSQGTPVLCGVDPQSTYVYLFEESNRRDPVSWWVALEGKKEDQGLCLEQSGGDSALGMRGGLEQAFCGIELRHDLFHAEQQLKLVERQLETRAYQRIEEEYKLDCSFAFFGRGCLM